MADEMQAETDGIDANAESGARKCGVCGAKSAWQQGFVNTASVVRGPSYTCITCQAYDQKIERYYHAWATWALVLTILGHFLTGSWFDAALFALAVYVFAYLAIVVHELGHFLTAKWLGVDVGAISFGGGMRTHVFRWRGMFVIIGPAPTEGLIVPAYRSNRFYRTRAALIVAAGPAANLLAAFLTWNWLANAGDIPALVSSAATLWYGINFGVGACNLFPFTSRTPFGQQKSDGAQLLGIFCTSEKNIREAVRARNATLALLELQHGKLENAYLLIRDELDDNKDLSIYTRSLYTAVLADTGRTEEGIALGRRFLAIPEIEPLERAMLQNNLAYTLYVSGNPSHLDEADELSARAMQLLPMLLAVRSTRGSILIETGRVQEGVDMLSDKRFRIESQRSQATVHAVRARGLALLGDTKGARESLDLAVSSRASNRYLRAAKDAIAAAS